jgi:5-methyltetrahydropteroyltriglutamate--homocysteine methyltransferase
MIDGRRRRGAIQEDRVIRAANHSSYPRVGDHPLDQQLRHVLRRRDRGEATDDDVRQVEDEVTGIVVAEQCRAFVHVVTDGQVRWEGPLSHVARHLTGLEATDLVRWFDTNFYDRRPVAVGPVRYVEPFLVHDYRVAVEVSPKIPVKVVLPGPVSFARLATDRHYGRLDAFAIDLAAALAGEVAELSAAGVRHLQLDEPMLCRHPEDLDLVVDTCGAIFAAAGDGATTVLSTYFGDLAAIGDRIGELPGTHLGLDMVWGAGNDAVLRRLPDAKGAVLGVFDARTTRQEDAADVVARLAPFRDVLTRRDVLVGPQAGLELLPRDQAFEKLLHARYVAERLAREWTWS